MDWRFCSFWQAPETFVRTPRETETIVMVGWNVFQYLQTSLMFHERLFLDCGSHNGSQSEEVSLSTGTQSTSSLSGADTSSTVAPILVYSKSSQNLIMEANGSDEVIGAILPQKSIPFPFICAWKKWNCNADVLSSKSTNRVEQIRWFLFFFVYLFLISCFYFCQVQNQCNKMPPNHCTQANVMILSNFIFKDYGPLILIACISVT